MKFPGGSDLSERLDKKEGGPLVTIIMPSLNQGEFIRFSLDSIRRQNYTNLQIVIADGGSTDNSIDIIREFCILDARIEYVSRKDDGPANALNMALRLAKGSIIGWLNSDDLYSEGAIECAVNAFQDRESMVMVYGQGKHIDENGVDLGLYPTLPPDVGIDRFQDGCFICQPTAFFKLSAINSIGFLDETLGTAFDFELWLRFFKCFPEDIGFIDRVQAFSRLHSQCITRRLRRKIASEGVTVLWRHLGFAEIHWVLTYLDEVCVDNLAHRNIESSRDVLDLAFELKTFFKSDQYAVLVETIRNDFRLRLHGVNVFPAIYSDGWVSPEFFIALGSSSLPNLNGSSQVSVGSFSFVEVLHSIFLKLFNPKSWVVLFCRFPDIVGKNIVVKLRIKGHDTDIRVSTRLFMIRIPISSIRNDFEIVSSSYFVPSICRPGVFDNRKLSFRVVSVF